jgi:hypothetical protein
MVEYSGLVVGEQQFAKPVGWMGRPAIWHNQPYSRTVFLSPGGSSVRVPKSSTLTSCILATLLLAAPDLLYARRAESLVIDHTCTSLADIPAEYIEMAKDQLRLCYGHTSHGSQAIDGMQVLMEDSGYNGLYDFNEDGAVQPGVLSIADRVPSFDIGWGDGRFDERTREYLDDEGADRNVVVWSWCGQVSDAAAADISLYLSRMEALEAEYPGVTFVYMTGHLDGTGESGNLNVRNNQIRQYCVANNKILYDFADIESYDPDGDYFLDRNANDACDYDGGNWAEDWCAAHPGDPLCIECDICAHSESLNCNLKARAFWWLCAGIVGFGSGSDEYSIAFSPSSFTFTAPFGGPDPANQTLGIWRSGEGTLNWSVSDNAAWLTLQPLSGSSTGEQDNVTLSVDVAGLASGTHNAAITITDPGAINSPRTVPVSLTVSAPDEYSIAFAPVSLSFTALQGGSEPGAQILEIWCQGNGTLEWSAAETAGWLALSPASGSSTGEHDPVTVGVDAAGLQDGTYDALITITAPGAENTPQTVPVSLTVTSAETFIAAGPGPAYGNLPEVRVFPPEQGSGPIYTFAAYGAPHYGVNVSCGRVNGGTAGVILTGAGPGDIYGPHVRGFLPDGTPVAGLSFLAYGTDKWGVNVAAGDLDGDGYDEIITGAGPGAVFGPHVRAFNFDGTPPVSPVAGVSYFAYGTLKYGVNVTAGDLDGDGYDEIITGAGPGAVFGPHVRAWNVDGGTAAAIPGVSFLAYGTNKFGVNVAAGDLDGDGLAEIVTAPGPSAVFGAHIRGWNVDGSVSPMPGVSFFAWPASQSTYGARVFAGADLDGDGRDDLVAGAGPDPEAGTPVNVYRYLNGNTSLWFSLEAFPVGTTSGSGVTGGSLGD